MDSMVIGVQDNLMHLHNQNTSEFVGKLCILMWYKVEQTLDYYHTEVMLYTATLQKILIQLQCDILFLYVHENLWSTTLSSYVARAIVT